jgi:tetratricopeptide (TPR) repeat protein
MKLNIHLNSRNQGVSVHVNGTRNVGVNKITKDGIFPIVKPKKTFSWGTFINSIKKKKTKRVIATVSAFILAGTITVSFLTRDTLENRLYKRYYRPVEEDSFIMIDNTEFTEAKNRYENGDPVAAWLIMKNLPVSSLQKDLTFYKAVTLMELKRYEEAIQYFDTLAKMSNNKVILVRTKWYQGLCYLKVNDIGSAKKAFHFVSPLYKKEYKQAQRILKKLKN